MKRPSFQFYPHDHMSDPAVRACCLAARGLWGDMLCIMHAGTPYGHLTLPAPDHSSKDGSKDILRPILPPTLARMVGASPEEVEVLLEELRSNGVFSRTPEGVIYSRRMVRDEKVREARASGGVESLKNPNVPRPKVSNQVSFVRSFEVSPSSSSSSSVSSSTSIEGGVEVGGESEVAKDRSARATASPRNATTKRATRLSPEFQSNDEHRRLAQRLGVDLQSEFDKFRDHYTAKPGRAGTSLDWNRNFANWLRRAIEFAPNHRAPAIHQSSYSDVAAIGTHRESTEPESTEPQKPAPWEEFSAEEQQAGAQAWSVIQQRLRETINRHSFDTWLKPAKGRALKGSVLWLGVPTPEHVNIRERYEDAILAEGNKLDLQIDSVDAHDESGTRPYKAKAKKIAGERHRQIAKPKACPYTQKENATS